MGDLTGQVVVCIGGASGMGLGVAEAAHAAGAQVVVTARSELKAKAAAELIGERASGQAVDLADEQSLRTMFESLGSLDHIMVTAGAQGRSSFAETSPSEAPAFMDNKLWANHRVVWEAHTAIRRDGSITLLTGGYAQWATPDAAHVHVAFAATEALARAVAVSLAPLRCNVIRPGFVDTDMWNFLDDDEREQLRVRERNATLTGRLVTPEDIGQVAVSLMSATAVTGAVVPVDGGRHLRPL